MPADFFDRLVRPASREHISERVPAHVQPEMTRNLLSRAFERSSLIADQYRALHDATKDRDDFTMPRRSTDPYDPHEEARQLRGLPVVGVKGGFGGAIKGTRPGDGIKL